EREVRGGDVAEAPGKHEVGQKDRGESNHDRNHEAGNNRQREEKLRLHEPGDYERDQQRQVQAPGRPEVNPPRDLNRQVDSEQDPNEDKRVDEPGGSEEQRELDNMFGLEQQEGGAHAEQVEVTAHRPQRSGAQADQQECRPQDERQRQQVEIRNRSRLQVEERVVVSGRWRSGG